MSRVVHKYVLAPYERPELPDGAELLHVGMQDGKACLWARVDPAAPLATRDIAIVATGEVCPEDAVYVGTIFPEGLVLHVFDRVPDSDRRPAA